MQVYTQVKRKVARFKPGRLITYNDFRELNQEYPQALAKSLQRLVDSGVLVREKKGFFYKVKKTRFGTLKLTEDEILKSFLMKNGKYVGYLSGLAVYLLFKISTQVPNETIIATPEPCRKSKSERISVKFTKSYVKDISKDNIYYLQLLDAFRFIKKVQDATPDNVVDAIAGVLGSLSDKDVQKLTVFALQYPPATKALFGAVIDSLGYAVYAGEIKKTLNPNSKYLIGVSRKQLPNKSEWRIR